MLFIIKIHDSCHFLSGLKRKLSDLAGKKVSYRPIGKWIPAIISHLYHVITNSDPHTELRREWWTSVVDHVCNIHTHPQNRVFKQCAHGHLDETIEDEEGQEWRRLWLDKHK